MLEKKYILNENPSVLDLRGVKDKKELGEIKKTLQTRFDLINLWADFEKDDYLESPLKKIHLLINRNNIKFLLEMLVINAPEYYLFDFSYRPQPGKITLRQPYKLTEEDFAKLIAGLKVNTHIKILCLYNLDHLPPEHFLELAEALKHSPVQAVYCSNKNLQDGHIKSIIKTLKNHSSLIQLTLSDLTEHQVFYQENAQHHIDAIKNCKTLTELNEYLTKTEYLLLPTQILRSGPLINKLASDDLTSLPKEYGLRYKIKILRQLVSRKKNPSFNTSSIMKSLPDANITLETLPMEDLNPSPKTPEKRKSSSMEITKENISIPITSPTQDDPHWIPKMRKTK